MIKEEFKNLTPEQIPAQIALYQEDERKGVQNFLLSQQKKVDKYYQEIERIENLCQYEKEYSQYDFICGIDEVGRGPLAGPVVAGAVVLPKGSRILYINDSKKLSEKKREELYDVIMEKAVAYGIGMADHDVIDEINILRASFLAMHRAVDQLSTRPEHLLIDGNRFNKYPGIPHTTVIKGDGKYLSIAAASILAKTYRDDYMNRLHEEYPYYDWNRNKGYPTKKHRAAIAEHGTTPYHRMTFNLLGGEQLSLDF